MIFFFNTKFFFNGRFKYILFYTENVKFTFKLHFKLFGYVCRNSKLWFSNETSFPRHFVQIISRSLTAELKKKSPIREESKPERQIETVS